MLSRDYGWWMPARGVAINKFGFNSPGAQAVQANLVAGQPFQCPVGINIGKNKLIPDELAPWAYAQVIDLLYDLVDYIVINPSSPNTPNLRKLQQKGPLEKIITAAEAIMRVHGALKPRFIKIAPELTWRQLDDVIEVAARYGWGIVAVNTSAHKALRTAYGHRWIAEGGGLSGGDDSYRRRATRVVKYIYEQAGDTIDIIGVGGINSSEAAIERIRAGASALQIVTAIRQHWGRSAALINRGLLTYMQQAGLHSLDELIGAGTRRGPKADA